MTTRYLCKLLVAFSAAQYIALGGVISYGNLDGSVIDFNGMAGSPVLGAGEVLTNQYSNQGVAFNVPNFNAYATDGVLASASGLASRNVIWIDQGGGDGGTSAQGMEITFSTPQAAIGLYFEISPMSRATLAVYDGTTMLESITSGLAPTGGIALDEGFLALQDPNITKAVVYSTNSTGLYWNFAVSNLEFSDTPGVPEPASLLLISFGLTSVGVWRSGRLTRLTPSRAPKVPSARSQVLDRIRITVDRCRVSREE
jgi:hypothetical protein